MPSAWAPLRIATFRSLWLALLASNIGTWMQTVGAQWLLVEQSGTDTLVAVVQTASTLPIVLLALPSGALADTFDRRRLLLAVQSFLVAVGALLTVLTLAQRMPPTLLLTLTFVLGAGQALTAPAWQAVIPELVPRPQLASASALGAISMNLARAVGPAVAGVLIARTGVGGGLRAQHAVVRRVRVRAVALAAARCATGGAAPERFTAAVRSGGRYVRHSPVVRRILLRAALFLVPGSALWALLPLVASRRLRPRLRRVRHPARRRRRRRGGRRGAAAPVACPLVTEPAAAGRRHRLRRGPHCARAGPLRGRHRGGAAAGRGRVGHGALQRERRDAAVPAQLGTRPRARPSTRWSSPGRRPPGRSPGVRCPTCSGWSPRTWRPPR